MSKKVINNFSEVSSGLNKKQATEEALRCPRPIHSEELKVCPLGIDVFSFVRLIREGDPSGALSKIREKNSLAGICGRVCPAPCMHKGVLGTESSPVNIRGLERYAADHGDKKHGKNAVQKDGKSVAVIGSGPAGLSAAGELAKRNYKVTVFEALHSSGGSMRYYVPEFRLPKKIIDNEIEYIQSLGVDIQNDIFVGQSYDMKELFDYGYKAILLSSGLRPGKSNDLPGRDLGGVYCAEEFLMRINLMNAHRFPKYETTPRLGEKVVIIGNGEAAFDAGRICVRLGKDTTLICESTEDDLAVDFDIRATAQEEGLKLEVLAKPLEIIEGNDECVSSIKCIRMDFADPNSSGNWKIIPVEGTEFTINADTVIIADKLVANISIREFIPEIKINNSEAIWVNKNYMTSVEGLFSCGGATQQVDSILQAVVEGKNAAENIDAYLSK